MALSKRLIALSVSAKQLFERTPSAGWQLFAPQPAWGVTAGVPVVGTPNGSIIVWRGTAGSEWCHYDFSTGLWSYKAKAGAYAAASGSAVALDDTHVYAGDGAGCVTWYNGVIWQDLTSAGALAGGAQRVSARSSSSIWACGYNTQLWEYNGAVWTDRAPAMKAALGWGNCAIHSVSAVGSTLFVVVLVIATSASRVARYDGTTWTDLGAPGTTSNSQDIWADTPTSVWIYGPLSGAPTTLKVAQWDGAWHVRGSRSYVAQYSSARMLASDGSTVVGATIGNPPTVIFQSANYGSSFADVSLPGSVPPHALGLGYGDTAPPVIADETPADGSTSNSHIVSIGFSVDDMGGIGVNVAQTQVTIDGVLAWAADVPQAGFTGTRTTVGDHHVYSISRTLPFTYSGTVAVSVSAADTLGNTAAAAWSFGIEAILFRAPLGALYIDELRDLAIGSGLVLLNLVPGRDETDVPHDAYIRLRIASLDNVAVDAATKVWVARSSDQVRRLAYDQAAGGFQAGFNGAASLATAQASPGSGVNDELIICIDTTAAFTSLESVLVEVEASTALAALSDSYSFTIEDLTAPHLDEILWLRPRRCRIKWSEPVDTSDEPGGSCFVQACLGAAEILPAVSNAGQGASGTQVRLGSIVPRASWIGYWLNIAGSAYPSNHKPRPIIGVNATTRIITVDTSGSYGTLSADDGNDWDDTDHTDSRAKGSGTLVRQRKIQASVSSYWLTPRLSSEGAALPSYSPERIQCAFCPIPVAASLPTAEELPAGEYPTQYVYIDWHDDVSYGRLYTLHADGVGDAYDNLCEEAQLDHQTPWFGAPLDRIKLWSNGFIPPPTRTEDLQKNQLLRKLVVVLQDTLNCLWRRVDLLQYIRDPGLCPDELVDFLLYEVGNPFRFTLTATQKRILISALPDLYKRIGTEAGIEEFLYRLLNIHFEITPYVEGDFWTLGIDRLGLTTMLGPGTARARNSYEIYSPVTLTTDERRIVTDAAEWADPFNMHLQRIVEPGMTPGPGSSGYWTLGISSLGISTMLGGS